MTLTTYYLSSLASNISYYCYWSTFWFRYKRQIFNITSKHKGINYISNYRSVIIINEIFGKHVWSLIVKPSFHTKHTFTSLKRFEYQFKICTWFLDYREYLKFNGGVSGMPGRVRAVTGSLISPSLGSPAALRVTTRTPTCQCKVWRFHKDAFFLANIWISRSNLVSI